MNWRVKGLIQKGLSAVPGGVTVNDWLQNIVGPNRHFTGQLESRVDDWAIFLSYTDRLGVRVQGLRLMEVGTGWFPTIPICYSLVGAGHCTTYDLNRHLSDDLTMRMLQGLEGLLDRIAQAGGVPADAVHQRYKGLQAATNAAELLRLARVDYRSPADASQSELADNSVDIVFSNNVLEHVPPEPIRRILDEGRRILKPGGLSIHSVNCGDHYAYFDKSITFVNYLTYSAEEWKFWDNDLLYQNRLRPSDFIAMVERAGLEVPLAFHKPHPRSLAALPALTIATEFQHYSPEQLCAESIDFVGRKPMR